MMLKDAFILVPPADEQKEIVDYLDEACSKVDVAISRMEDKIRALQEMKNRIIEDTVFGKIDVREIDIPEYEYVDEDTDSESDVNDELYDAEEQED